MVTLNSLNEWFENLKEREQVNVLSLRMGEYKKTILKLSKKKLIHTLFYYHLPNGEIGDKNDYKKLIKEYWDTHCTPKDKLDLYSEYNECDTNDFMELLDINDVENFILFINIKEFVMVLDLDKPYTIYTIEHLMKIWNGLTYEDKLERLKDCF